MSIQYQRILNVYKNIFTDRKAVIRSLGNMFSTSKIVRDCQVPREEIFDEHRINKKTDALAKAFTTKDSIEFLHEIGAH